MSHSNLYAQHAVATTTTTTATTTSNNNSTNLFLSVGDDVFAKIATFLGAQQCAGFERTCKSIRSALFSFAKMVLDNIEMKVNDLLRERSKSQYSFGTASNLWIFGLLLDSMDDMKNAGFSAWYDSRTLITQDIFRTTELPQIGDVIDTYVYVFEELPAILDPNFVTSVMKSKGYPIFPAEFVGRMKKRGVSIDKIISRIRYLSNVLSTKHKVVITRDGGDIFGTKKRPDVKIHDMEIRSFFTDASGTREIGNTAHIDEFMGSSVARAIKRHCGTSVQRFWIPIVDFVCTLYGAFLKDDITKEDLCQLICLLVGLERASAAPCHDKVVALNHYIYNNIGAVHLLWRDGGSVTTATFTEEDAPVLPFNGYEKEMTKKEKIIRVGSVLNRAIGIYSKAQRNAKICLWDLAPAFAAFLVSSGLKESCDSTKALTHGLLTTTYMTHEDEHSQALSLDRIMSLRINEMCGDMCSLVMTLEAIGRSDPSFIMSGVRVLGEQSCLDDGIDSDVSHSVLTSHTISVISAEKNAYGEYNCTHIYAIVNYISLAIMQLFFMNGYGNVLISRIEKVWSVCDYKTGITRKLSLNRCSIDSFRVPLSDQAPQSCRGVVLESGIHDRVIAGLVKTCQLGIGFYGQRWAFQFLLDNDVSTLPRTSAALFESIGSSHPCDIPFLLDYDKVEDDYVGPILAIRAKIADICKKTLYQRGVMKLMTAKEKEEDDFWRTYGPYASAMLMAMLPKEMIHFVKFENRGPSSLGPCTGHYKGGIPKYLKDNLTGDMANRLIPEWHEIFDELKPKSHLVFAALCRRDAEFMEALYQVLPAVPYQERQLATVTATTTTTTTTVAIAGTNDDNSQTTTNTPGFNVIPIVDLTNVPLRSVREFFASDPHVTNPLPVNRPLVADDDGDIEMQENQGDGSTPGNEEIIKSHTVVDDIDEIVCIFSVLGQEDGLVWALEKVKFLAEAGNVRFNMLKTATLIVDPKISDKARQTLLDMAQRYSL